MSLTGTGPDAENISPWCSEQKILFPRWFVIYFGSNAQLENYSDQACSLARGWGLSEIMAEQSGTSPRNPSNFIALRNGAV